jgi:hypothetical protein
MASFDGTSVVVDAGSCAKKGCARIKALAVTKVSIFILKQEGGPFTSRLTIGE